MSRQKSTKLWPVAQYPHYIKCISFLSILIKKFQNVGSHPKYPSNILVLQTREQDFRFHIMLHRICKCSNEVKENVVCTYKAGFGEFGGSGCFWF